MGNSQTRSNKPIIKSPSVNESPYVLNLYLKLNADNFDENLKAQIMGIYSQSAFTLEFSEKMYQESNIMDNDTIFFNFKIPFDKQGFERLNNELCTNCTFQSENSDVKENDSTFTGNGIKIAMRCIDYGVLNKAEDIQLSNANQDKQIYFQVNYQITGLAFLNCLTIDNISDENIIKLMKILKSHEEFDGNSQVTIYCKAVKIIMTSLETIITSGDKSKRDKYVTENLNKLLVFLFSDTDHLPYLQIPTNPTLCLNYFLRKALFPFNQRVLFRLIEEDLINKLKFHLSIMVLYLSQGVFDFTSESSRILTLIGNDIKIKNAFFQLFLEEKFIKKCLKYSAKHKIAERKLKMHIFFYIFLSSSARKIMYEHKDQFRILFDKDDILNPLSEAILQTLDIEFTNRVIFYQLLKAEVKTITSIKQQHQTFLQVIELNSINEHLLISPWKDEENKIRKLFRRNQIRQQIIDKLSELANSESNEVIVQFFNKKFLEILEYVYSFQENKKYPLIGKSVPLLTFQEALLFLNPKFINHFIKNDYHIIFDLINSGISDSLQNVLKFNFDSVVTCMLSNKLQQSISVEVQELIIKNYSNQFVNLITKDFLSAFFNEILPYIDYETKGLYYLFTFPQIKQIIRENSEHFLNLLSGFDKCQEFCELFLTYFENIKPIYMKVEKILRYNVDLKPEDIEKISQTIFNINQITCLNCEKNIPVVFTEVENQEFFVTHLWLKQPHTFSSMIQSCLFLSGTGEHPSVEEIEQWYDYSPKSNLVHTSRLNYLGYIMFEKSYEAEKSKYKEIKCERLVKSSFVVAIFLDKFGLEKDPINVGGIGYFGSYDQIHAEQIFNHSYAYSFLKRKIVDCEL